MTKKESTILKAIFDIVVGILLLVGGASTFDKMMSIIVTVYAVYLIVMGVLYVVSKNVLDGIINIVFGAVLLSIGWTSIAWISTLILGIYLIIVAIYSTFSVFHLFKVSSLLTLLIGILLILIACGNHFAWQFINVFFYICGAFILVRGILTLVRP